MISVRLEREEKHNTASGSRRKLPRSFQGRVSSIQSVVSSLQLYLFVKKRKEKAITRHSKQSVSTVYQPGTVCGVLNPRQIPLSCYPCGLDQWVWLSTADANGELNFVAPRQIPIPILIWFGRRYQGNADPMFVRLFVCSFFFVRGVLCKTRPSLTTTRKSGTGLKKSPLELCGLGAGERT